MTPKAHNDQLQAAKRQEFRQQLRFELRKAVTAATETAEHAALLPEHARCLVIGWLLTAADFPPDERVELLHVLGLDHEPR